MKEWKKVRLRDCIREVNERTIENNQYEVLTSSKSGIYSQEEYFDKQVASKDNTGYKILRKGQFTYRSMSDNGTFTINRLENKEIGIVSPAYPVFEVTNINAEYLKYYFQSDEFKKSIYNLSQGSTRTALKYKDLSDIEIFLPSKEEQILIVRIFENIDKIINTIERKKNQNLNYKNSILSKISNEEFEEVILENIFEKITDYVAAGSFADLRNNVKYNSNKDYAQLIRTIDIKNKFKNEESIYVSKPAFDFLWRVNLIEDNIVLPNIGANIGEVYYISKKDLPYENNVLGPNAILLGNCKNLKYMYYYFQSSDFQKKLQLIVGASGQPKFNKTDLKRIRIKIPNMEMQNNVVKVLEKNDKIIDALIQKTNEYKLLKKALMQQLLTGKIRVKI